jgi:hypothetical protein
VRVTAVASRQLPVVGGRLHPFRREPARDTEKPAAGY